MALIFDLARDSVTTIKEEGFSAFINKSQNFLRAVCGKNTIQVPSIAESGEKFKDILFINGCGESVPHPARYRVTHQREQLESCNITTDEVYYMNINLDQVRCYRTFIFFRCPYTDAIGEFIKCAKKLNKYVLFDIDDLVIDTIYTDTIKYLDGMTPSERRLYDDGVNRMGRTLKLCDAAITTTERLATELSKYVSEVFINRNVASEEMKYYSDEALKEKEEDSEHFKVGYFSGSFTHNDDFELIKPILKKLMRKYEKFELHLVGELNLPEDLLEFKSQIVVHPFVDWKKLPKLIAQVDVNLAPLEQSIFNEAKSENKWVEAALVKVPTVASNVGAFARMIEHGKTGYLCNNLKEWESILETLIHDDNKRKEIAYNAYEYCNINCITTRTGYPVTQYVKKYMKTNIGFVVPPMTISGGIMVALRHASILRDAGYDTFMIEMGDRKWIEYEGKKIPVINRDLRKICGRIDKAVATMWTTVEFLEHYPNIDKRYYLVQGYETDFYAHNDLQRRAAYATYFPKVPINFITISKWCKEWLEQEMHQTAKYAPNGLDLKNFPSSKRSLCSRKIRILVEGNCGVESKNIDESFKVIEQLDPERFEIWYLSYNAKPKAYYRVDKSFNRVPYEEVGKIYQQCDILLKTSYLESFSYPPLEMMATGGYCVVVPNGGNMEYLEDGKNCLLYPQGDIEAGVKAVYRICEDEKLREQLYEGGIETAKSRSWENCRKQILQLYM